MKYQSTFISSIMLYDFIQIQTMSISLQSITSKDAANELEQNVWVYFVSAVFLTSLAVSMKIFLWLVFFLENSINFKLYQNIAIERTFFSELCRGKAMVAYSKPSKRRKQKATRRGK